MMDDKSVEGVKKPSLHPALALGTDPKILALYDEQPPQSYQEVSMLPSPRLDSDSGVFETFSGTSRPPVSSVSRAPSYHRRGPLRIPPLTAAQPGPPPAASTQTALSALSISTDRQTLAQGDDRVVSDVLDTIREAPAAAAPSSPTDNSPTVASTTPIALRSPQRQARDRIVLPKRGDPRVEVARSVSLGNQRPFLAAMHREGRQGEQDAVETFKRPPFDRQPSASTLYRGITAGSVGRFADKEDVYVAFDSHLRKGAWDRLRFLGKGSFSQVILATPTLSQVRPEYLEVAAHTVVAVKITELGKPGSEQRGQLEEALRRDIELVKELSHPSLMSIIAFNMDAERALVVLPYCPGGDMFDLIEKHRTKLSEPLIRRLYADVVSAVAYLHENYVVHRDIKLENVLIDIPVDRLLELEDPLSYPNPLAVLTDLGLARRFDPENPLLTTRCGSEDYVPPELLMGQPYDGRQTDSWGMGVLLYAILEGRLPFDPPPHSHPEGARTRLRTVHRIARVDWAWYKRKESEPEWDKAKEIVEGCLRRRDDRLLVSQIALMPWIQDAIPPNLTTIHFENLMEMFNENAQAPLI